MSVEDSSFRASKRTGMQNNFRSARFSTNLHSFIILTTLSSSDTVIMPFSPAATLAFFTDHAQIGLDEDLRLSLVSQGVTDVTSLAEFDDDDWDTIHKSTIVQPPAPTRNAPAPPARKIPARSLIRLKIASEVVRYYRCINRPVEPEMMLWPILEAFKEEWKALKDRKEMNPKDIPKLTKNTTVIKWSESFETFLRNSIGVRNIPLIYVIRDVAVVPIVAPPLLLDKPFSAETGAVSEELISRADHNHPKYRDDSLKVLQFLDEALAGSAYVQAISKFRKSGDGRGAYLAIISQYGGTDKWHLLKEAANHVLREATWNGTGTITLSSFILRHRNAFVDLESCVGHVDVEVPTERLRVEYLLKGVQSCTDMTFMAHVANVKASESDPVGTYASFERTCELLLKACPVARKIKSNKFTSKNVSSAEVEIDSLATDIKKGPTTGVEIRYYKPAEYARLSAEQKKELKECKAKNNKKKRSNDDKGEGKDNKKVLKRMIASAIKKHDKKSADEKDIMKEYVSQLFPEAKTTEQIAAAEVKIQAITKMVKDKKKQP